MKNFLSSPRAFALVAIVFAAIPGIVMAGPITVDGVRDGNDAYTNSFIANWTNEHHKHGSIFDEGTDETTVWWELNAGSYYLFIEASLVAKNMIWGAGVTAAELTLYDAHNTHIEDNGNPHHGPLSGIDYNKATGSEKAIFEGITAKLKDDSLSGASSLAANAISRDYLVNNAMTCDTTDCAATTTTMSFEFQFGLSAAAFQALLGGIATNGIEFHLSPERGGPTAQVPAPATLLLMIFGGLGMFTASMRRKQTY